MAWCSVKAQGQLYLLPITVIGQKCVKSYLRVRLFNEMNSVFVIFNNGHLACISGTGELPKNVHAVETHQVNEDSYHHIFY
jgi:hypothetical protein